MAYTKTNWQNGVTPVNADNMNKIENELEALDQRGGGGGFTPRLLYPTEQLTHTGGHGTIARQDFCFDITASEVAQWSFTANVKCYVMATNSANAYSYGKIVNVGESVGVSTYNSGDTHIKIYPINDYVSSNRIIGTFNCIQD